MQVRVAGASAITQKSRCMRKGVQNNFWSADVRAPHRKIHRNPTSVFKMYRVSHKFSYTWNELFVVNWFISTFYCENTKWKQVSYQHYLTILIILSKHGLSYSLKCEPRSISKITFYANLSVSPIDTELWDFFQTKTAVIFSDQQYLHSEVWIRSAFNLTKTMQFFETMKAHYQ